MKMPLLRYIRAGVLKWLNSCVVIQLSPKKVEIVVNPIRKLAVVIAVMLAPIAANADLINLDDVTRDTSTDIDWLDLTITVGTSYEDYLAGALGLIDEGWAIATGDQVSALLGMHTGLDENVASSNFLDFLFGASSINLLGCTLSVNSDLCSHSASDPGNALVFAAIGIFDDTNAANPNVGLGELVIRIENHQPSVVWSTLDDFYRQDRDDPQVGIFLTRPVSVPEPGTLALLGIGLFGMSMARRRRET